MRLAVLSRNPSLYSTRRLVQAGEQRGHTVEVIDYLRCYMNITAVDPIVMYQGRVLRSFDAVIPRIGASNACYGAAVVRQFELMGALSANSAEAISRSHDRLGCLQLLSERGIDLPSTGFAHSNKDLNGLVSSVGTVRLVVKLLNGTPGTGAILAETQHAAESVIEAFQGLDAECLVQEFIREASGESLRLFVVGVRVVAAMRRRAPAGEFRSNLHRGGHAEKVKVTPAERHVAIQAAKAIGLNVAGIDLLRSRRGALVIGVNSTPELEGIESASSVDVAVKVIEYLERSQARTTKAREPALA